MTDSITETAVYKPTKAPKGNEDYKKVWKIIDGAVADALTMHPDYLTDKGKRGRTARYSIVKRVTGSILSYVEGRGAPRG